jgi:hypothetical protein
MNTLTGTIPTEFGNLSKLHFIDFVDNLLEGTITVDEVLPMWTPHWGSINPQCGPLQHVFTRQFIPPMWYH